MWWEMVWASLALLMLLYIPGSLLLRGMGLSRVMVAGCAPCVSIGIYALLCVAYGMLGIRCSVVCVGLPALLVGLLVWFMGSRRHVSVLDVGYEASIGIAGRRLPFDLVLPACYVLVGLSVTTLLFVGNLSRPDSIVCDYDNQTHLNAVLAFLDSGVWSTLHVGPYLAITQPQLAPVSSTAGAFYPAGWHDVVAMVSQLAGVSVPVATNAMILVVCAVAYPLSAYLFLRVLLSRDRLAMELGALLPLSCAAVPWMCVAMGPTLPDMAGRLLVLGPLAVVVQFAKSGEVLRRKVAVCAFVLCSFAGLALLHPNTVFTAYVFLGAFGAHALWKTLSGRRRVAVLALYCFVMVGLWVVFYQLPFLQSTIRYYRSEEHSVLAMLRAIASFGFNFGRAQLVLTALMLVGVVAVVRRRELWLLFPVLFFCVCYVSVGAGWKQVSYWFAAFWYQASIRFPPSIVVFSLPCLALGAAVVARAVRRAVGHGMCGRVAAAGIALVLCVANYAPVTTYSEREEAGFELAFGCVDRKLHNVLGDESEQVYSVREMAFVERAKELLPDGAYVLNAPNDGSMWAYAVNELPVFYRDRVTKYLTDDAELIRRHLREYATDDAVRRAVERTGIGYVLVLDKGVPYEEGSWLVQYSKKQHAAWAGIYGIDDNTPGFSVLLAEDDMRLYRIDI